MSDGYTAVVIGLPMDSKVVVRKVQVDGKQSLKFLQKAVGGYIEHLSMPDGELDLWLNEEGKLEGLPINSVATDLLWLLHPAFRGQDVLVGPIVLTGHDGPETASIPEGFWNYLKELPWQGQIEFIEEETE